MLTMQGAAPVVIMQVPFRPSMVLAYCCKQRCALLTGMEVRHAATVQAQSLLLTPRCVRRCAPRLRVARDLQEVARLEGVRLRAPGPLRLATLGRLRPAGAVLRHLAAAGLPACSGLGCARLGCVGSRRPQLLPREWLPAATVLHRSILPRNRHCLSRPADR